MATHCMTSVRQRRRNEAFPVRISAKMFIEKLHLRVKRTTPANSLKENVSMRSVNFGSIFT